MIFKYCALLVASLGLLACSEESADKDSGGSDSKETSDPATGSTGNRFFDSAVKKISSFDEEVSPAQAAKIVTLMTADGSVGLGEINGMNLQDLDENSDVLRTAYEKAKASALAD